VSSYPPPRATEFSVVGAQATLFTPGFNLVPNEVAKKLIGGPWGDQFDGDPIMLPFDSGIPKDIPKVILRDKRGEWNAEIADERVSIKWRWVDLEKPESDLASVFRRSAERLEEYRIAFLPRVGRLAAVVQRFAANDAPGLTLAAAFCGEAAQAGPLNRPQNFELHAHKVFAFGELNVNSWVRNKTAHTSGPGAAKNGILVEQDINTLAEQAASHDFRDDKIARFFSSVGEELDSILALYYPTKPEGMHG
jgi:hypothetical protein